jgi:hypothetical protein
MKAPTKKHWQRLLERLVTRLRDQSLTDQSDNDREGWRDGYRAALDEVLSALPTIAAVADDDK